MQDHFFRFPVAWLEKYRIAGNFRGRELLRLGEKYDIRRENFHRLLTFVAPKDSTPQNFMEKTFTNNHKTPKFAKVFSLENFPLYGHFSYSYSCFDGRKV